MLLTGLILGIGLALAVTVALRQPCCGGDYRTYMDATERWLSGGPFYQPWQMVPYEVWGPPGAILYPPIALVLFVPFTFLPAVLWWAIPLGATVWIVVGYRPRIESWPLLALCLAWPLTYVMVANGNPVMWAVAFLALGTRYKWPAVFVLIKPSLAPFALFGVRNRSWWVALAAFCVASLAFGAMWLDWLKAITNATDAGLLYSLRDAPLMFIPLIAWYWRTTRSAPR